MKLAYFSKGQTSVSGSENDKSNPNTNTRIKPCILQCIFADDNVFQTVKFDILHDYLLNMTL